MIDDYDADYDAWLQENGPSLPLARAERSFLDGDYDNALSLLNSLARYGFSYVGSELRINIYAEMQSVKPSRIHQEKLELELIRQLNLISKDNVDSAWVLKIMPSAIETLLKTSNSSCEELIQTYEKNKSHALTLKETEELRAIGLNCISDARTIIRREELLKKDWDNYNSAVNDNVGSGLIGAFFGFILGLIPAILIYLISDGRYATFALAICAGYGYFESFKKKTYRPSEPMPAMSASASVDVTSDLVKKLVSYRFSPSEIRSALESCGFSQNAISRALVEVNISYASDRQGGISDETIEKPNVSRAHIPSNRKIIVLVTVVSLPIVVGYILASRNWRVGNNLETHRQAEAQSVAPKLTVSKSGDVQEKSVRTGGVTLPSVRNIESTLGPGSFDAANFRVGDMFRFSSRIVGSERAPVILDRKILSFSDNKMVVGIYGVDSTEVKRRTYHNSEWGYLGSEGSNGSSAIYSPALKYYDFPLRPGKKWVSNSKEKMLPSGREVSHSLSAEVEKYESIDTPLGPLHTAKVIAKVVSVEAGKTTETIDVSWFSASLGRSVRSELTSTEWPLGNTESRVIELTKFTPGSR